MKTVLVVDDDDDIRELITWKLKQAGYGTLVAADGEMGVRLAIDGDGDGHRPDLVLLDWMMPGMAGTEVCRLLRGNASTARLPIILLTARAQESEVERGFAAGVDDYIIKPFSPRAMMRRVEAVLARSEPPA